MFDDIIIDKSNRQQCNLISDDKSVEETSDSDNENEETLTKNLIKQVF